MWLYDNLKFNINFILQHKFPSLPQILECHLLIFCLSCGQDVLFCIQNPPILYGGSHPYNTQGLLKLCGKAVIKGKKGKTKGFFFFAVSAEQAAATENAGSSWTGWAVSSLTSKLYRGGHTSSGPAEPEKNKTSGKQENTGNTYCYYYYYFYYYVFLIISVLTD